MASDPIIRTDGRAADQLRPVRIARRHTAFAPGSVLMAMGRTQVLCTAYLEAGVPPWREASGLGWLTAEYDMLPSSTPTRRPRSRMKVDGRAQEIQRLIGRSLRAVVDFEKLGANTLTVDCDVIQADGGTRTAAITGSYVAVCDAVADALAAGRLAQSPIIDGVAAVSVGLVGGEVFLDLDYREDVGAAVDMNVAMTGSGRFVEIQATGESATFSRVEHEAMLAMATAGVARLLSAQRQALTAESGRYDG